ncbi:hypothetical protein BJX68DRAFT_248809 [Aspergillus pseudodeflectus]|uniref:Zn(2)-C6 fungal-type domain-containing protein n=1 Tax=Aspergillus pseudodeflectus TaxID=176178 RepID=A0ABR4JGB0_9EURO
MDECRPTQPTPPVSKRPTACVQCQKHKVRCVLPGRKPPCHRCLGKRLPCVFKKDPTYPLPSSENRLLSALLTDLETLQSAVNELRAAGDLPDLPALQSTAALAGLRSGSKAPEDSRCEEQYISGAASAELIDKHPEAPSRDETTATQPPIQSLYQITHLRSLRSQGLASTDETTNHAHEADDLISRKTLSTADAKMLVNRYLRKTDHYLYGIASEYKSLNEIRQASPLLLTAILTVEALQRSESEQLYRVCYAEFRNLMADFLFSHSISLEDLRGLCIACFWLSDISWSISSVAIRRAVELELHKSFPMAIDALKSQQSPDTLDSRTKKLVDSVRIWHLLYICDQHLAILYGRPHIMREDEGIQNWALYLAIHRNPTDIRILSQVALLQILRSVSETFGQDSKRRVPVLLKPQLDAFLQQIDQWVNHWLGISQDHPIIGAYPSKAIMLHHHFSKLLVSSHVFRGIGRDPIHDPLPVEFQGLASVAIDSARAVLETTVTDPDIIDAFVGIPHYYQTMIAFACSFLLKTAKVYRHHVSINSTSVIGAIRPVIDLCLGANCTSYHLAHWIGRGLRTLLSDYIKWLDHEGARDEGLDPRSQGQSQNLPAALSTSAHMDVDGSNDAWGRILPNDDGENLLSSTLYESVQPDLENNMFGFPWDPSISFASLEHMGLGLL